MPELVLVTGCTGYVAGQICAALKAAGFRVRGTMRSQTPPEALGQYVDEFAGGVDLLFDGGWKEAMAGVNVVMHAASPVVFDGPDEQLLHPALYGSQRVLRFAAAEASVRGVVVTSSVAAMLGGRMLEAQSRPWTEVEKIDKEKAGPYAIAKAAATEAAHGFRETEEFKKLRPAGAGPFHVCTVHPCLVLGPAATPELNAKPASQAFVGRAVRNQMCPPMCMTIVDARDVAQAHLRAAQRLPEADGRRLVVLDPTSRASMHDIKAHLANAKPELGLSIWPCPRWAVRIAALFNKRAAGLTENLEFVQWDNSASNKFFAGEGEFKYHSWKETVEDNADWLAGSKWGKEDW